MSTNKPLQANKKHKPSLTLLPSKKNNQTKKYKAPSKDLLFVEKHFLTKNFIKTKTHTHTHTHTLFALHNTTRELITNASGSRNKVKILGGPEHTPTSLSYLRIAC
jgi:hypothetical protein